ncbi:MAG: DUF1501 domain-containing protein [Pirellula sp.]|nr:DUF1501 domain-containing protein [Pirellula sp.]
MMRRDIPTHDMPSLVEPGCESYGRMLRRRWMQQSIAGGCLLQAGFLTQVAESIARAKETSSKSRSAGKRPKAMILLWMQGGPSQLETFDPHPGTVIGGEAKAISTSLPELSIADTLPQTAELMHHATLVRSMVSKEGDHERATYNMKTGWRPDPTLVHPSIGAVLCHQTQSNIEIPRHISILAGEWSSRGGFLGSTYDAFRLGDPKDPLPNLKSYVAKDVLQQRIGDLEQIESRFRRGRMKDLDRNKTLQSISTERATVMMASEQIQAFEIERESQSVQQSFGDTPFGRGCLAAVRLVEQGVTCVEIELSGWDTHVENHTLQSGRCKILDAALHGLVQLLLERDLLDSTVVMCGGEFGRTPKINIADGRDHWPTGFSTVLFGGPFRQGYVHGETTSELIEEGKEPLQGVKDPVRVEDLHATLLHGFGINFAEEIQTPIGRPLARSQGSIIEALMATV